MDITPYVSAIVTAVIAIVGGYVAMKNANNAKLEALSVQIATLSTQICDLKEQVEKHNGVIERTYRLETEMNTAFKHIDALRERDDKIEQRMEKLHG